MDWWILEIITVAVLIALVAILGPLIKRFGKAYAADVFRANPRTGKSYLVLMDFAYYMIFGAYILFVIQWEPDTGWDQQVNAEQLQGSIARIGGMVLLMGLLHGLNVLTLPIIGRIFTLNRRLDEAPDAPLPPPIDPQNDADPTVADPAGRHATEAARPAPPVRDSFGNVWRPEGA
jgi:hypothetical protein